MEKEQIVEVVSKTVSDGFNDFMEKKLIPTMDEISVKNARKVVEQMTLDRHLFGFDRTGLSDENKKDFAAQIIAAHRGDRRNSMRVLETKTGSTIDGLTTKANESLIEEQDNRGGYLVQPEVAAAILRIAASVGTILKQAQKWPMKTDELGIPNYTGSFLTGSYVGVDLPGTVTGLSFGQAVLIARKWQLAFTVGNDLLNDASVQLGDWLLSMAGEALANMIDQQGFVGGGTVAGTAYTGPFVGIVNTANTNTYTLASGSTSYSDFDPVDDANNVISTLEESVLDGAAWYMHRTVWAALASKKTTEGLPYLFFGALSGNDSDLTKDPQTGPVKSRSNMGGFPVITNRWLPATTVGSQAGTPFIVFGNMKAMAFGDKGDIRVGNFQSGTFNGKEIALADQSGIVYKHRHALVVVLPKAFTVVSTAAS